MANSETALAQHKWWKEAIIYQVYPALSLIHISEPTRPY